ncbi:uncharacterized protein LOC110028947 [Phalaenopsis equestris]|uniref:uncharacterized protein LOC110028947 n=1 Tax=Phalaenopsis equestris TaxID=78828 RepID=UPI0009E3776D|nr:uncharacterized protein LOC110028947 [Phalaenopsis equestris]
MSASSVDMDWKSATCAVCMEPPHNAILLLCSSHEKGCRPYMCDTSYQHSNCLELFKKAYMSSMSSNPKTFCPLTPAIYGESKSSELPCPQCPLCRSPVKGWTVIRPARKYLNNKRRSCMQGNCSFVGTFMELQKHAREDHPFPRPQEVDPELEKKWREFELERDRQDAISFINSSMPNSLILGDYVIERDDLHNNIDRGVFYSAEDRLNQIFNDLFYDDDVDFPRVHRRRRRRQRRMRGSRVLGFSPFLTRWRWMYQ